MHLLETINYKKAGTVLVLLIIAGGVIFFLHSKKHVTTPLSNIAHRSLVASAGASQSKTFDSNFVSVTGPIQATDLLWDGEYLKPVPYAVIYRKSEMYAWVETKKEENGTTTYEYHKDWQEMPALALFFNKPEGHSNPLGKSIRSRMIISTSTNINGYHVDMARMHVPTMQPISLSADIVIPHDGAIFANGYLYKSINGTSTIENPAIGDVRVSYDGLANGTQVTAFGQLENSSLIPYVFGEQTMYILLPGTRDEALKAMDNL